MGKKRIVTTEEKPGNTGKKVPEKGIENISENISNDMSKNVRKDTTSRDKSSEKKKETNDSASKQVSFRKRLDTGILHVQSTYNNTKVLLTNNNGQAIMWSSSGSLGFKGAKKGTPFAAAKVGETLAVKAQSLGLKEISVVVKGVGSGRESAIRGFISKGVIISSIKDSTPVPHNGPQPKKPRRV